MFIEFFTEVFIIKIKLHGFIENKTKKEKETIDTTAIRNKDIIKFMHQDTKYKIGLKTDEIILKRENANIKHNFIFKKNTQTKSNYYIKEYSSTIEVTITTKSLSITNSKIEITYIIDDTKEEYKYVLEMSE